MTDGRTNGKWQKKTENDAKWDKMTQKMIENETGDWNVPEKSEHSQNDCKWSIVTMCHHEKKMTKKLLKMSLKGPQKRSKILISTIQPLNCSKKQRKLSVTDGPT